MTDKATYLSLIEGNLDNHSLQELETLVEENPWFSLAHMALAKRYFDSNHSGYTDQLGKAAVYVGSPSILYDIIMEPEQLVASESREEQSSEAAVETQEIEEDILENEVQSSELETEEVVEDPVEELLESEEEVEKGIVEKVEGPNEEPVPIPEFGELETNLVVEAISDSIEKEVTPRPVVEEKKELVTGIDSSALSALSQWMLRRNVEVGFTSEPSSFQQQQAVSSDPDDLIDRFIETSPKITPKKVGSYSTENMAKESLVEDESIVTETMARIYAQQGKLEKSRRAYRLLSLKYPEKSVYFAAQLKKLGKNSN